MKTIKLPLINQKAEKTGEKLVEADIFANEASEALIAQAVRRFLSNQRKAFGKTKTRGQITGSTAKIWRQKGTGRARHGDRQAPIFVGGGKAHGPTGEQHYQLGLNQKMNRKAIYGAISLKLKDKKAFLIDEIKLSRTKEAFSFIKQAQENLGLKGEILLIYGHNEDFSRYFRNLANVKTLKTDNLNVYFLLKAGSLLLTQAALTEISPKEIKKEVKND